MAKTRKPANESLFGLILAVIENEPLHGYAIAKEIEKRSKEVLSFGEGTLYPALRGLERDGFIIGSWDTSGTGPAKKVYQLTPAGKSELTRRRVSWHEFSRSVDKVLGGNPRAQES